MKLANIAIGQQLGTGIRHASGTYSATDTDAIDTNSVVACRNSSGTIYIGDGTVPKTTYVPTQYSQLRGIAVGNTCLTTTPYTYLTIGYTSASDSININQKGFLGRAFNNQVNSTQAKDVWGIECVFKVSSLASESSLFEYGYNPNNSANTTGEMSWYKIYISTAGRIRYARKWYSSQNGQWNTGNFAPDAELTYSGCPSIQANKWYKMCLMRIADGESSAHGDKTTEFSLYLLEHLCDNDQSLAQSLYGKIWYLPSVVYTNGVWSYGQALNNLNSINTKKYAYGRFNTQAQERTTAIDTHILNADKKIQFAGSLYLKGGYYSQQTMQWNINQKTTTFTSSDSSVSSQFATSTLQANNTTTIPQPQGTSKYFYWYNSI